jgi:hypothetical protein
MDHTGLEFSTRTKDMKLPRQKKLYKRGILMEVDFVAVGHLSDQHV